MRCSVVITAFSVSQFNALSESCAAQTLSLQPIADAAEDRNRVSALFRGVTERDPDEVKVA